MSLRQKGGLTVRPSEGGSKTDAPKERWIQWVALTTTILAVCAAISSLKGGSYSTRVQLATTKATNSWSYFQSKSIKQHSYEVERDLLQYHRLQAATPAARRFLDAKINKINSEVSRYDGEMSEIKSQAEKQQKDEDFFKTHSGSLNLAAMFLQIAIMLSSIAALLKRPHTWLLGLMVGVVGLVYMVYGLWL